MENRIGNFELGSTPEVHSYPEVEVVFAGWDHTSVNTQGANRLVALVESKCDESSGKVVVHMEGYNIPVEESESLGDYYNKVGPRSALVHGFLQHELGRNPAMEEIDELEQAILREDSIVDAAIKKLIPGSEISNFALYFGLDHLVKSGKVEIAFEAQNDENIKASQEFLLKPRGGEVESWNEGDLDKALEINDGNIRATVAEVNSRNKSWSKGVVNKIDQLKKLNKKSTLIVIGGVFHHGLLCDAKQSVGTDPNIRFSLGSQEGWNAPDLHYAQMVNEGFAYDQIPNDLKAQALIAGLILTTVWNFVNTDELVNGKHVTDYYEDIKRATDKFAASLSYKQIEIICRDGMDLLSLFKESPISQDL